VASEYPIQRSETSADEERFLEDRLYEFNSARTGHYDGRTFAFVVRNEKLDTVAGLAGWTWARACEIKTLWVHPSLRGQGYGRNLVIAAEQEAKTRGCTVIFAASYSFQAPGFYRQLGYSIEWNLEDFPPGYRNCFLVKRF
jgi:GNAT superfamily N-acetyltransferase